MFRVPNKTFTIAPLMAIAASILQACSPSMTDAGVTSPPPIWDSTPPAVAAIAAAAHACALSTAGTAYCWGYTTSGQPGTGVPAALSPTSVAGAVGIQFQSISVSKVEDVTCAVSITNVVYCWGENDHGQLGDGTAISRDVPAPVEGGLKFKSVSVGDTHVCGLTLIGAAYCWGFSQNGALGDGASTTSLAPAPAASSMIFQSIAAGGDFTCGLTPAGAAYCWGLGNTGQLGDGAVRTSATPSAVAGGLTFRQLVAGGQTACAVTDAGQAYCWGNNFYGTVGDGTSATEGGFTRRATPVAVVGDLTFASLSAGYLTMCGVTPSGAGYCWGYNFGAVGDGSEDHRATPTAVAGGLAFQSISSGTGYSCGLTRSLSVYCWGDNSDGALGDGTILSHDTPQPVRWP